MLNILYADNWLCIGTQKSQFGTYLIWSQDEVHFQYDYIKINKQMYFTYIYVHIDEALDVMDRGSLFLVM